jgi:hypothetical protein
VPKYVLINNGSEWVVEFNKICKNYGIVHQHTTPQWPRCNNMVERMIKPLKHGLIVLSTTLKHTQNWDRHLPIILFGYWCGI